MLHKNNKTPLKQFKTKKTNILMQTQVVPARSDLNIFYDLIERKSILIELFEKNKEVVNYCAVAPSPSRDYNQILITFDQIIFRLWKITRRNDSNRFPVELKSSFQDYKYDDNLKHHILCAFGKQFSEYVKNIVVNGHVDYIQRLPEPILLKIISYLSLEDLSRLSQVNTYFRELCRSDRVWMDLYKRVYSKNIKPELMALAQRKGWRSIFFTNKIKLQVQLRREYVDEVENDNSQQMITRDDSFLKVLPPIRRHSSKSFRNHAPNDESSNKPLLSARLPNNKSGAKF